MKANTIFNFLRGALRGAYGTEDLRNKKFLLIGMSTLGQSLLGYLCIDGIDIRFHDSSLQNYHRSFGVCRDVDFYDGEDVDVTIDLNNGILKIGKKTFPIKNICSKPYTQGIHEFYL